MRGAICEKIIRGGDDNTELARDAARPPPPLWRGSRLVFSAWLRITCYALALIISTLRKWTRDWPLEMLVFKRVCVNPWQTFVCLAWVALQSALHEYSKFVAGCRNAFIFGYFRFFSSINLVIYFAMFALAQTPSLLWLVCVVGVWSCSIYLVKNTKNTFLFDFVVMRCILTHKRGNYAKR